MLNNTIQPILYDELLNKTWKKKEKINLSAQQFLKKIKVE